MCYCFFYVQSKNHSVEVRQLFVRETCTSIPFLLICMTIGLFSRVITHHGYPITITLYMYIQMFMNSCWTGLISLLLISCVEKHADLFLSLFIIQKVNIHIWKNKYNQAYGIWIDVIFCLSIRLWYIVFRYWPHHTCGVFCRYQPQ